MKNTSFQLWQLYTGAALMSGRFRIKSWWQDRTDSSGNHLAICHFGCKPLTLVSALCDARLHSQRAEFDWLHSVCPRGCFKAFSQHQYQVAHRVFSRVGPEIELSSPESLYISKLAFPLVHRDRNVLKENTFWKSSNWRCWILLIRNYVFHSDKEKWKGWHFKSSQIQDGKPVLSDSYENSL